MDNERIPPHEGEREKERKKRGEGNWREEVSVKGEPGMMGGKTSKGGKSTNHKVHLYCWKKGERVQNGGRRKVRGNISCRYGEWCQKRTSS